MICASAVSAPTRVARNVKLPVRLSVAAKTSAPVSLATGMLSPVSIDSSTVELPETTTPSVGIFSPGRTMISVPLEDPFDRDILLDAVPDDAGRLGLQPHQTLNRLRGPALGLRLEEPAEDDQGHDEGRPVVIDVGHDLRRGEELREEGRQGRVEIGGKRPHGDQGVHVGGLLAGRLEGADEEAAPHPEDDGRRQEKEDDHAAAGAGSP